MKKDILIALLLLFTIIFGLGCSFMESQLLSNPIITLFLTYFGLVGLIVTFIIFYKSYIKK